MFTKKVRFESPDKGSSSDLNNLECQSPRPFLIQRHEMDQDDLCYRCPRLEMVPSKINLVEYYKHGDTTSSTKEKTALKKKNLGDDKIIPSSELELSIFDINDCNKKHITQNNKVFDEILDPEKPSTLPTLQHKPKMYATRFFNNDNGFFLKRDQLFDTQKFSNLTSFSKAHSKTLCEHNIQAVRSDKMKINSQIFAFPESPNVSPDKSNKSSNTCRCQCTCDKENYVNSSNNESPSYGNTVIWKHSPEKLRSTDENTNNETSNNGFSFQCRQMRFGHSNCNIIKPQPSLTNLHCECCYCMHYLSTKTENPVKQKKRMIENLETRKQRAVECKDIDKSIRVRKSKCEPTVSDLFSIIKLQNEQLQLLQERVEKLISTKNTPVLMNQNFVHEHVAVETVDQNHQKMSIGVMTSFEVVRTSTYINKEIPKNQNAQVQCNRSEISVKEVITRSETTNENFLEGITSHRNWGNNEVANLHKDDQSEQNEQTGLPTIETLNDDKTLNELSLCNLQIDNATTPQLSPDQTLYLDVRDYSESESEGHSNVGWTYYNKVMTHVNCMLDDSEMPSSASAVYRKATRQVQMQIDKGNNVSVTKRVKFGDDPFAARVQSKPDSYQPLLHVTDTSMKMNALAAKYLKTPPQPVTPRLPVLTNTPTTDMSFATRNYMERHQLLQGISPTSKKFQDDIPRFLDITALKQQPKLL